MTQLTSDFTVFQMAGRVGDNFERYCRVGGRYIYIGESLRESFAIGRYSFQSPPDAPSGGIMKHAYRYDGTGWTLVPARDDP